MANPSSISSGVGFRHVQILALNSSGYPNASGTSVYEGVTISGAKALTINDPEPRQIVHIGDDRPFALDVLPSTEPITGELRSAKQNDTVDTMVQSVNQVTVGEAKLYPIGTNERGNEPQVTMVAYRQAVDTDLDSANFGQRVWQFRLFPKCYLIPREAGFEDNPEERPYTVRPQYATKYPWGVSFSDTTEGCTQAQGFRGVAEYKPKIVSYLGNNVATQFNLPTTKPAQSTSKIKVWVDGTLTATTNTTTSITFAVAPTTNGNIVVFYEHS
jgi:hypothetical protein